MLSFGKAVISRVALILFALLAGVFETSSEILSSKAAGVIREYCTDCHDSVSAEAGLDLEKLSQQDFLEHTDTWEKVIRRVRTRQMPPPGKKRPDENAYQKFLQALTTPIDTYAAVNPNPGRTDSLRRLNRTEYQNAIRDLLAVEIDPAALLPKDEAGHGFDNVTVGDLSPTLLERYLSAAQKISRQALGMVSSDGIAETFRVPPAVTQEDHLEGLPLGTRGGVLINYQFPQDATYEIQVRLARDRNEDVEGLNRPHQIHLLVDGELAAEFTILPPSSSLPHEKVDQHLKARLRINAGPRKLGVTFPKTSSSLLETRRQPYEARFNVHRHPRQNPAVYQVTINGPIDPSGPGNTPSRERIFVSYPKSPAEEEKSAREILSRLAKRAFRGAATAEQVERLLTFYRSAAEQSGFEPGIQNGLSAILASPQFLFRIETEAAGTTPGRAYAINDLELASRLSFFLWSSLPDDELLEVAEKGGLREPGMIEKQTLRMLRDPRTVSLVRNFASQWLHLRNLDSVSPDARLFPDFDDNLRQAMRMETELLLEEILREDLSLLALLRSDGSWINERLARHYNLRHVQGDRFRKVLERRGGLLRHASVLTVTSYATRTSPVIRGNWILANLVGTPAPPPPPNVPALQENTPLVNLPIRERLARHRENTACASCHNRMDPIGFALENFDAVGRWRELDDERPVESPGALPDGTSASGVEALEAGLLRRPEDFVHTAVEKLLTFGLGRGIEPYDQPAIRKILLQAAERDYCFSSIIVGIVTSKPFTMRTAL